MTGHLKLLLGLELVRYKLGCTKKQQASDFEEVGNMVIRGVSQKFHNTHCFATIKAPQNLQHL